MRNETLLTRLVAGALALAGVGAIGPWATAIFVSASGLDGDGWIVLGAAVGAGLLLYLSSEHNDGGSLRLTLLIFSALASLGAFAVAAYDWNHISQNPSGFVSVGWGVQLAAFASGVAASATWLLAWFELAEGDGERRSLAEGTIFVPKPPSR